MNARARAVGVRAGEPPRAQREDEVLADREPGKERGLLEHEQPVRAGALHLHAVDRDAAAARGEVAGEGVEERRLPAAGGAEQAHELARVDLDVHVVEGDHLVRKRWPTSRTSIFGRPARARRGTSSPPTSRRPPPRPASSRASTSLHMTPQCALAAPGPTPARPPAVHHGA